MTVLFVGSQHSKELEVDDDILDHKNFKMLVYECCHFLS